MKEELEKIFQGKTNLNDPKNRKLQEKIKKLIIKNSIKKEEQNGNFK